jgi:hypothetical protein
MNLLLYEGQDRLQHSLPLFQPLYLRLFGPNFLGLRVHRIRTQGRCQKGAS